MDETVERNRLKSSPLTALANFYRQVRNQAPGLWRKWTTRLAARGEERVGERALAKTFFKLGATGFGGGLAVIAHIRRVLELTGGHRSQTAELLGISRKVLWEKMRDFGLEPPGE